MKYNELAKKLKKAGCYLIREGGRHEIWYSPITDKHFELGRHGSEEVKKGTLMSIKKASGVNV